MLAEEYNTNRQKILYQMAFLSFIGFLCLTFHVVNLTLGLKQISLKLPLDVQQTFVPEITN